MKEQIVEWVYGMTSKEFAALDREQKHAVNQDIWDNLATLGAVTLLFGPVLIAILVSFFHYPVWEWTLAFGAFIPGAFCIRALEKKRHG